MQSHKGGLIAIYLFCQDLHVDGLQKVHEGVILCGMCAYRTVYFSVVM